MNNLLILAQTEVQTSPAMGPMQYLFGAVYLLVCVLMILSILAKTPKNDGMGGLTGGGTGGAETSFKGAKSKDDRIDTLTNWIALAFIGMSIGMNFVF